MSKFLVLILLVGSLVLGIYLVTQRTYFTPKADISAAPQDVKISNISENSFTVSWITSRKMTGFISYGKTESLGTTASDLRDNQQRKERFTHLVTLEKLEPETVYYFKIGEESKQFLQKTAPILSQTPLLPQSLFGQVIKKDKGIPEEGLIYLTSPNSTLLSAYLDEAGKWLLTLANLRSSDLGSYKSLKEEDVLNLQVEGAQDGTLKREFSFKESTLSTGSTNSLQVSSGQAPSVLNLSLTGPQTTVFYERGMLEGDLNNDGVTNVFDFALHLKRLLFR